QSADDGPLVAWARDPTLKGSPYRDCCVSCREAQRGDQARRRRSAITPMAANDATASQTAELLKAGAAATAHGLPAQSLLSPRYRPGTLEQPSCVSMKQPVPTQQPPLMSVEHSCGSPAQRVCSSHSAAPEQISQESAGTPPMTMHSPQSASPV